jgi:hypothetical protein
MRSGGLMLAASKALALRFGNVMAKSTPRRGSKFR